MVVKNTGWINPARVENINGSINNPNNLLNSNETYAQFNTDRANVASADLVYNIPNLNGFSKYLDWARLRGQCINTADIAEGYFDRFSFQDGIKQSISTILDNLDISNYTQSSTDYFCGASKDNLENVKFVRGYNYRYYYIQRYIQYVEGSFSIINNTPLKEFVFVNNKYEFNVDIEYSIYSNQRVKLSYEFNVDGGYSIDDVIADIDDNSIFDYFLNDVVSQTLEFQLNESFLNQYYQNINSEYSRKINLTFKLTANNSLDEDFRIYFSEETLGRIGRTVLPRIETFDGFLYSGSNIVLNDDNTYLIYSGHEIMPESCNDVLINNISLNRELNAELFNFNNERANNFDIIFGEDIGNTSSLELNNNSFELVLLSNINNIDLLHNKLEDIFQNNKNNIKLKLGIFINKIIPCNLSNIEVELHRTYSYITFTFEKLQRTSYNHYNIDNITSNNFSVPNYQRQSSILTIKGSGQNLTLSITDDEGLQQMTIFYPFSSEIVIDSTNNTILVDKVPISLNNITYTSDFFELKGNCTATLSAGQITKVVI